MFGLSFLEISLILVAAIIFLKPEDIPVVLKKIGKGAKKIKDFSKEITDSFSEEEITGSYQKTKFEDYKKHVVLGEDGQEHEAYFVEEVYPDSTVKKDRTNNNSDKISESNSDEKN